MSTPINDGGPAFPTQEAWWNTEKKTYESVGPQGMTLRDWFAGQERLAEWDNATAVPANAMCEALAGEPIPDKGWAGDMITMLKWEAKWRAALRYIRADAMLAERAKGGAR